MSFFERIEERDDPSATFGMYPAPVNAQRVFAMREPRPGGRGSGPIASRSNTATRSVADPSDGPATPRSFPRTTASLSVLRI